MRTPEEERELQRLIREQRRDDRPVQLPEKGTVGGYGLLIDLVEGGAAHGRLLSDECPIHGVGAMTPDLSHGNGIRCKTCSADDRRLRRATQRRVREQEAATRARAKARRSA